MLGGENVRELLCVRVYFGQQFLKSSGGIMRVRFCVLLHDMRGGRFTKVCSEAAICLNIEKVVPHCRCRGGEVSGQCGSGGGAMTFRISPRRLGRILPGGVEMKRRNWCCVGVEETIGCQSPRGEPRVLGISTQRRVSACGPRRVEFAKASAIACGSQEVKGWSLTA